MKSRLVGLGIVGFWLVTMVALVQLEYSERLSRWDEVPPIRVLQRIIDNPDTVHLNISSGGRQIGTMRFDALPYVETTNGIEAVALETAKPSGYRLRGDTQLMLEWGGERIRVVVTLDGRISRRFEIEDLRVRGNIGGSLFQLETDQTTRRLAVSYDLGDGRGQQKLNLDESSPAGVATALGLPAAVVPGTSAVQTRAYAGRFRVARSMRRGYLIETRVGESIWLKILTDEAGQVLEVTTSGGITLRSDVYDQLAPSDNDDDPMDSL